MVKKMLQLRTAKKMYFQGLSESSRLSKMTATNKLSTIWPGTKQYSFHFIHLFSMQQTYTERQKKFTTSSEVQSDTN